MHPDKTNELLMILDNPVLHVLPGALVQVLEAVRTRGIGERIKHSVKAWNAAKNGHLLLVECTHETR